MMNEVKKYKYIRTKDGHIGIIIRTIYDDNGYIRSYIIKENSIYTNVNVDCIKKYSNNIIDLIEEGDFVNEQIINEIETKSILGERDTILISYRSDDLTIFNVISEDEIENILTKEIYMKNVINCKGEKNEK